MPQRDPAVVINSDEYTATMELVYNYFKMTETDAQRISDEITTQKRQAYEAELTLLAGQAGCPSVGAADQYTLESIDGQALAEAVGIVNTYNYDLAQAIIQVHNGNPKANRNTYWDQLTAWNNGRAEWKYVQISMHNEQEWRAQAQLDFTTYNDLSGWAELLPKRAAEPICQEVAARERIPMKEAQDLMASWPPHLNCPHYFVIHSDQIPDCGDMWLGANSGAYIQQGGH